MNIYNKKGQRCNQLGHVVIKFGKNKLYKYIWAIGKSQIDNWDIRNYGKINR